jgi:uncharacterized protein YdcH (DUF465 family)
MQLEKHTLLNEFPNHHHTIRHLKMHDAHFTKLFDEYHQIESEVHQIEENNSPVEDDFLESLKKRRLFLKDELFILIQQTEHAI